MNHSHKVGAEIRRTEKPEEEVIFLSSMSAAPKRGRQKPESSSHHSSAKWLIEPPQSLFPSKDEFRRLILAIAIASSVAVGCNFLFSLLNRQPKPFCDSVIDYGDLLPDFCEPCPDNGVCSQGNLECVHGYKKHGRICVEDGVIHETAWKLVEWVESRLCAAYVQHLCYGTGKVWVLEDEIRHEIDGHSLMENPNLDKVVSIYAKQKAMEALGKMLESRALSHGMKELKCPDLLVENYKPFTCCIYQWISEHSLVVVPAFALLVGCTRLIQMVCRRRYLSAKVEELYNQVCGILEENALTSKSNNGQCEPWVVASRLRDHLLLPRERKNPDLWNKVEELVLEDSRIDQYPKLLKGESKVVWEWQVEGSLSSGQIRKRVKQNRLRSCNETGDMASNQQKHTKYEADAVLF